MYPLYPGGTHTVRAQVYDLSRYLSLDLSLSLRALLPLSLRALLPVAAQVYNCLVCYRSFTHPPAYTIHKRTCRGRHAKEVTTACNTVGCGRGRAAWACGVGVQRARAACGVRRAACGVRRSAWAWAWACGVGVGVGVRRDCDCDRVCVHFYSGLF